MALGFTSHFTKSEHPFGSLILSNSETETSGSVAYNNTPCGLNSLYNECDYDSCDFSVTVNIDYSQYANYIGASSTETAGSVAYSPNISTAATISCGAPSVSCCSVANTFTC